jgi:hypothetical protein
MIKKIEIEGETIHLNKSKWFGWGVCYPLKNEDGSWNYFNLITGGSIWKLIFVLVFMAILFGAITEYKANMEICTKAVDIVNRFEMWEYDNYEYNWTLYDFNSTEVKNG